MTSLAQGIQGRQGRKCCMISGVCVSMVREHCVHDPCNGGLGIRMRLWMKESGNETRNRDDDVLPHEGGGG